MSWLNECLIPHTNQEHEALRQYGLAKPIHNNRLTFTSNPTRSFAGKLLGAILLASIYSPTNSRGTGTLDLGICCMQAARSHFPAIITDTPWDACGVDPNFDFSKSSASPSVNVTLKWCMEHCGGWQASSAEQWLQPLASWVIPALALLILCSVGEKGGKEDGESPPFGSLYYQAKEYVILLGDPASAICGGFSELWTDAWLGMELMKIDKDVDHPHMSFDKLVIGMAMLTSQTSFRNPEWKRDSSAAFDDSEKEHLETENPKLTWPSQTLAQRKGPSEVQPTLDTDQNDLRTIAQAAFSHNDFADRLRTGIKTVLKARIDFVNGVALPVLLALAATASSSNSATTRQHITLRLGFGSPG